MAELAEMALTAERNRTWEECDALLDVRGGFCFDVAGWHGRVSEKEIEAPVLKGWFGADFIVFGEGWQSSGGECFGNQVVGNP
jgi:hypothetical protein